MIRETWKFISDPKTLAVLALAGSAVAFVWNAAETHLFPPNGQVTKAEASKSEKVSQSAVATGSGSTATNAGPGATVTYGAKEPKPSDERENSVAVDQRAEARDGGTAVNAGPNSHISVTKTQEAGSGR